MSSSADLSTEGKIEAAWDFHVHGPTLSLVAGPSCHRISIGTTNVTTARLNPKHKPATDLGHGPLPGKVVDFVFFLEPTNNTERAFGGLTWEPNHGRGFNHTLHGPIANRPNAISMETEGEGEGQIMGRAQLENWVAAHSNRLQEMAGCEADGLPSLPLLLTQEPIWSLLLACRERAGETWATNYLREDHARAIGPPSSNLVTVATHALGTDRIQAMAGRNVGGIWRLSHNSQPTTMHMN
ncbi:hypothetical protein LTR74_016912 [Friedmanniomyces endolithicus]|nr:hypothetical protein LTR74_016912 [Friedmanniomyces endolithicus]